MRIRLLAFFSFLCAAAGGFAQTTIGLRIDHKAGQAEFDASTMLVTPLGELVNIDRLEYYLSDMSVVHDGGQETPLNGAYVLADAFVDEVHPLGLVSGVESVEGLKFKVGIDPENNHSDPVTWPQDHPLAPQVPSMHWGWSAGYIFVALDGDSGPNGSEIHQVHALGDDNHQAGEMDVVASIENGVMILDVEADVLGFYNQLSVAEGFINHGEDGEAVLVCYNLADDVFRLPGAVSVSGIEHDAFDFHLVPREGGAELRFDQPLAHTAEVSLLDILGRPLHTETLPEGTTRHAFFDVHSGAFLVTITTRNHLVTRRWIQAH